METKVFSGGDNVFKTIAKHFRKLRREWIKRRWIPRKYWDISEAEYKQIYDQFFEGLHRLQEETDDDAYLDSLNQYLDSHHDEFLLLTAPNHYWDSRLNKLFRPF